jgi:hypothetical protein
MKQWVEYKPMSGTNVLKRTELQLRTVSIQDNTFSIKIWRKQPKSSESDSFQLSYDHSWSHEILTKNLGRHRIAAKFMPFLLCEDRNKIMFLSVKSLLIMQMLLKTFKEHHHRWWNLGLQLWCRNKSPLFTVSLRNITHTQKSTAGLVQCKSDAVFCDCEGLILHHEFLPHGQTEN